MRRPHVRFTVWRMMVVVAVVAGLLTLQRLMTEIVVEAGLLTRSNAGRVGVLALAAPCLAWALARWLSSRGYRRLAAGGFAGLAILINVSYAAACTFANHVILTAFLVGWLFLVFPMLAGLGAAWTDLATRGDANPRRSPKGAWLSVIALAVMPLATLLSLWPARLGFLIARPTLERLADRASAGQKVVPPQWAGPFRIVGSYVDPRWGGVILVMDTNPGGFAGSVRGGPAVFVRGDLRMPLEHQLVPLYGPGGDVVPFGWGWRYYP
jgi:hypothetical protein